MDEKKAEDFSKTTMWKKSIEAEKARANSAAGKFTVALLALGGILVVATAVYFLTQ